MEVTLPANIVKPFALEKHRKLSYELIDLQKEYKQLFFFHAYEREKYQRLPLYRRLFTKKPQHPDEGPSGNVNESDLLRIYISSTEKSISRVDRLLGVIDAVETVTLDYKEVDFYGIALSELDAASQDN